MDQFDMSMPGEPQIGLPGNHTLNRIKQEAGVELGFWDTFGTIVGIGGTLFGANESSKANKRAEQQVEDQWEFAKEERALTIKRADRDWQRTVDLLDKQHEFANLVADTKHENDKKTYNYGLQIRQFEIDQNQKLYGKSQELYQSQLDLNSESAYMARQDAARALGEETRKYAFLHGDAILESVIERGKSLASGQQGRSLAKTGQSQLAALGKNQAVMAENLAAASVNTKANLMQIDKQHAQANLSAWANRMLEPVDPPIPPEPTRDLVADVNYPFKPDPELDFGPEPVKGVASYTPVWGPALSGIGQGLGQLADISSKYQTPYGKPNSNSLGILNSTGTGSIGSIFETSDFGNTTQASWGAMFG